MIVKVNTALFKKDMNNIINYSIGFLEGIQQGKMAFLKTLGVEVIETLKAYVDASARMNPEALHHVYEWYRVGSPESRLYDINYTVSGLGLSLMSTFKQSTSIKQGSNVPFYNKAFIIENGIPVTIKPTRAEVLVFEVDGEEVFSRSPITISNPGGTAAQGGFEKVFDSFFNKYFTQAFLRSSGIAQYLEKPMVYKKNLQAGKKGGRSVGTKVGYRWIANAGVGR